MIIPSEVLEFINMKSKERCTYSLSDFFKIMYEKYYTDINIEFMYYFLDLINYENEFYVDCKKLYEYDVISPLDDIDNFLINKCKFTKDKDYTFWVKKTYSLTGKKIFKKNYFMTPEKFKYCVIKFSKTNMYIDYFLLLEKIHKYYNLYLKMSNDNKKNKSKRKYIYIQNISDSESSEEYVDTNYNSKKFKKQKILKCSKIINVV